jgi:hypothetical protein
MQPISAATATWSKTDWSTGTNTIKAIGIKGTNIAAEKFKVRYRKNAGSWFTVTPDLMLDEASLDEVTFTSGDTAEFELSFDLWNRLDGHASFYAVRDKLPPTNVALQVIYEDTEGDVYVPYATPGFRVKQNATGAFKATQGE